MPSSQSSLLYSEFGQPLTAVSRDPKQAARPKGKAGYLSIREIEVFVHVHPECGGLQTAQADDAILGASDSDIIHREEPVTVGIRLEGESGL